MRNVESIIDAFIFGLSFRFLKYSGETFFTAALSRFLTRPKDRFAEDSIGMTSWIRSLRIVISNEERHLLHY